MTHCVMHTLPSGLRIIASVEPEAAVSYVGLGVRVGARDEGLRWHGLAHSILEPDHRAYGVRGG